MRIFFDNNTIIATYPKVDDDRIVCHDGLIFSVWQPQDNITVGDRIIRGIVYFLALAYLFIGELSSVIFPFLDVVANRRLFCLNSNL